MKLFPRFLGLVLLTSMSMILVLGPSLGVKPLTVGSLTADLEISGYAREGQIIYTPRTGGMQVVFTQEDVKKDEYGNTFANVSGNYSLSFQVMVDSRKMVILKDDPFPTKYEMPEFLGDTAHITPSNPEIRSLAREITKNSRTTLEAVISLALWTHSHIKYDEKYLNVILSGPEVMRTKKGVCDEYATLYASLSRASGIPTRIVTGVVNSGTGWRRHAWAESYVSGTWIPVDPNFAEVGQIDATHIKIYSGPDYPAYLKPGTTEGIKITNAEFGNYSFDMDVSLDLNQTELAPRQMFNVGLYIKNYENFIVIPTFLLQSVEGFEVLDAPRKAIVLYPQKTGYVSWSIIAPYGERDKYYLALVGPMTDRTIEMSVNKSKGIQLIEGLSIDEVSTRIESDKVLVDVGVLNKGNMDLGNVSVKAFSPDFGVKMKFVTLLVGESRSVEFSFPRAEGSHVISVEAQAGEMKDVKKVEVFVPRKVEEKEDLFFLFVRRIGDYSLIVLVAFGLAILVLLFIFLAFPTAKGRKFPFKEKKKWMHLLGFERRELPPSEEEKREEQ